MRISIQKTITGPYNVQKSSQNKKKGKHSDMNNYRPVSLLSCVSKVFEKAVFKFVFNYLCENISIHQSGFLPLDLIVNQFVYLYNFFSQAIDRKKDINSLV